MTVDQELPVSVAFKLAIDDRRLGTTDLGTFTSCEGLGVEVVMETREEGGANSFVWQLPSRLKYTNIKLTRPLTKDTQKVAQWFSGMVTGVTRSTGHITAMTHDGQVVARWSFRDVVPVRWTGPSMSAESPKVATETIEIAHHGFTEFGAA